MKLGPIVLSGTVAAGLLAQTPTAAKTTNDRIQYYSGQIAAKPGDAHLRALLTLEYLQKVRETGDSKYLKLASTAVASLLGTQPGNAEARRLQNEVWMQLHEFRKVAANARELLAENSSDVGSWGNLGDALMELGRYGEAGEAYKQMLSRRPNLASYNRAAYFHFVTGNAPVAIRLMQSAIEAGSRVPEQVAWCWAELGDMYFKTDDAAAAREAYRSALALHGSSHRAHSGLGRLLWSEHKLPEAAASYRSALAVLPLPEYVAALGDIYQQLGRTKEARNQEELLLALAAMGRAGGEKANRVLGVVYADRGHHLDEALSLVQNEFANRDDVYTYDALAWVLLKLNRVPEAEAAMAKALRLNTPEPSFRAHAAAIASASEAIRLNPAK